MKQTVLILAKATSIVGILVILGSSLNPNIERLFNGFLPEQSLGFILFPLGYILGLILAWKYAAIGGIISLACLVLFHTWVASGRGNMPTNRITMVFALPSFLFYLTWRMGQYRTKQSTSERPYNE